MRLVIHMELKRNQFFFKFISTLNFFLVRKNLQALKLDNFMSFERMDILIYSYRSIL